MSEVGEVYGADWKEAAGLLAPFMPEKLVILM